MVVWANGMMSGINLATGALNQSPKELDAVDYDELYAQVHLFCVKNRQEPVFKALVAYMDSLPAVESKH
jgi:hypothetical protein